jgi:soluble lytic murein transglycosylase-like protein
MSLVSKPQPAAARSGVASFVRQACLWANIFFLLLLTLVNAVPGNGFAPLKSVVHTDVVVLSAETPAQPSVVLSLPDRRQAYAAEAPARFGVPNASQSTDPWQAHIAEASARFGVPEQWIRAVMTVESGGRVMQAGLPITSPKGAMGLMQVMSHTYADLRERHGFGPDAHNPRDNILAGVAYLSELRDRFGYPMLFAAYNAGPTRTAEALKKGSKLPPETRAYLKKVTANVEKPA